MDNIEAPRLHHISELLGAFAIVSVDPVASVSALRDDKATLLASQLPRKKYLVILSIPWNRNPYLPLYEQRMRVSFFSVGRGLSPIPYASVGLFPGAPHPDDRAPIIPASPLPWDDCYVHTLLPFEATVSRMHSVLPATRITLSVAECTTLAVTNSEDTVRRGEELYPESLLDLSAKSVREENADPPHPRRDPTEPSQDRTISELGESDSSGSAEPGEPREMLVHVELWQNLSVTDEIGSPAELIESLAALRAIEEDWAQRASVATQVSPGMTIKWVESIAGACPHAQEPAQYDIPCDGNEESLDENTVWPEDAIEHRIAAERRRRKELRKADVAMERHETAGRDARAGNSAGRRRLRLFSPPVKRRARSVLNALLERFAALAWFI